MAAWTCWWGRREQRLQFPPIRMVETAASISVILTPIMNASSVLQRLVPTNLGRACTMLLLAAAMKAQEVTPVPIVEMRDQVASGQRVWVRGVVTFQIAPGFVFLQDDSGSACIHLRQQVDMAKGDVMEMQVDSYLKRGEWHVSYSGKKVGSAPLPPARKLRVGELDIRRDHGALIALTGRVIGQSVSSDEYFVNEHNVTISYDVLTVDCDGMNVRMAFLQGTDVKERFPMGCVAEFTGAARIHDFKRPDGSLYVAIWVDGPGDVRLLKEPPIWTVPWVRQMLWVLGAVLVSIVGGVIVAFMAQRRRLWRMSQVEEILRLSNAELEERVAMRTQDLNEALARERELGEMKSRFVTLVSHEFRTPLGVIMAAGEVLSRYFERLTPEKRERHLGMILNSTRNLAGLIDEVLLVGSVEEGRMTFTPEPVNIEELCRTMLDEVRSATSGRCPVELTVEGALEGAVSDAGLLRHILSNLLSNACKYSDPGSPVHLRISREGGMARFVVEDHGIGIPEAEQAQLFTRFTRASNVGTRPGTGLGLVVVQRCVQLHGGQVHLTSAEGAGTTVTVELPLFPESSLSQEPATPEPS